MKQKHLIFGISGIFLVCMAIIVLLVAPIIIYRIIYRQLQLEPDTRAYKLWKDIPVPIYQRFYFFNVTNAIDVERRGAKPNLVEVGPFTYRSKWSKNHIKYHENGTVSYREKKTYYFVPEQSISDESINITTLNAPLAITLTLLQNAPSAVRVVVTLALDATSEGFFIKRTPKQLLFDGYADLLTTFGPLLNPRIPSTNNGRFGWLYGRNGTDEGVFTVHTGSSDIHMLNLIEKFKGSDSLNYWASGECNSLAGSTNAQIFPPMNDKDSIYFFHPDFCRKWKLNYNETFTTRVGITAKRYVPDSSTFQNADDYPPNACYISKLPNSPPPSIFNIGNRLMPPKKISFPSGVFDMSVCKYGAPVLMSYPHFQDADPSFAANLEGMKPDSSKHGFYMSVEPTTGASVDTSARIQINVFINKPPGLFRYRNVPDIVFPVFWQELSVSMSEELGTYLKWVVEQPSLISSICSTSILIVGIVLIATSLLFPLYRYRHEVKKTGRDFQANKVNNSHANDKNGIILQMTNKSKELNGISNPALDST